MNLPSILGSYEYLQAFVDGGLQDLAKAGVADVVRRVLSNRRRVAFDLLLNELQKGNTTGARLAAESEVVSVLLRFQRAADEGAARLNLRIIAKIIAGEMLTGTLRADEFLYRAEMLAGLKREEIVLIATLRRLQKERPNEGGHDIWKRVPSLLVPDVFLNEAALRATAQACLRTGLIADENTIDHMGWYVPSPLFAELERMASFEQALSEEEES